jgi:hypothetical protein
MYFRLAAASLNGIGQQNTESQTSQTCNSPELSAEPKNKNPAEQDLIHSIRTS